MVTVAAEQKARPFTSAGRARVHQWARFTVGAAGAVTLDTAFSDPGITLGDFTDGVAELAYPIAPKTLVRVDLQPAAITDDSAIQLTDQDSAAGTAELTVHDNGTPENPAEGAVVIVEVISERHG